MTDKSRLRPASAEEAKKLGIPPAYTDVQVSDDPNADLVAMAWIPKTGKPFYKYSQAFIAKQAEEKWRRVRRLGGRVEKIEARILRDAQGEDANTKELALMARLVLLTGMRNGGDPQGEGESYGASSLRYRHVTSNDGEF